MLKKIKRLEAYFFLLPTFLLFITFTIIPTISGVRLAFYDAGVRHREFVGLKNFQFLFSNQTFQKALKNTLHYMLVIVPMAVLLPLLLALAANQFKRPHAFRIIFVLPYLVSAPVIAAIWKFMFDTRIGLLNIIFNRRIQWLSSNPLALYSTSIVHILMGLGIPFLIYLAALQTVDKNTIEMAQIDGANKAKITLYILIPHLLPIMAFITIISTIGTSQIFGTIYMLTHGGPSFGTTSVLYLTYQYAFEQGRYGLGSAVALVMFLMMIIFTIIQLKLIRRKG